jgi:hypothetical protein
VTRQKSDRSEARRRYRAELSASEAAEAEEAAALAAGIAPSPARPSRSKASDAEPTAPAGRMGLFDAFRLASRPADLRGDLAAFPSIATGTKAVWLPAAIVVIGGALIMVESLRTNTIVALIASISVSPQPTMIPAFLAGMLTRRASWLAGGVAGLISAVVFDLVYIVVPPAEVGPIDASVFLTMLVLGPLFGASVGAFAGFYRRFLAYSSPPRDARSRSRSKRGATKGKRTGR